MNAPLNIITAADYAYAQTPRLMAAEMRKSIRKYGAVRHLSRHADPVQRIWTELRFAKTPVAFDRLTQAAGADASLVMATLSGWLGAGCVLGLLAPQTDIPLGFLMHDRARKFTVPPTCDLDEAAPEKTASLPKRNGRQRIWSAMRVLKSFDLPALLMASGASKNGAADYLKWLEKAGYVRSLGPSHGGHRQWILARYTGPKHPHMLRAWVKGDSQAADQAATITDGGPAVVITDGNNAARYIFPVRPKSAVFFDRNS